MIGRERERPTHYRRGRIAVCGVNSRTALLAGRMFQVTCYRCKVRIFEEKRK